MIDTDCTGSCKSNYHAITTTMASFNYIKHWYFIKFLRGMTSE